MSVLELKAVSPLAEAPLSEVELDGYSDRVSDEMSGGQPLITRSRLPAERSCDRPTSG